MESPQTYRVRVTFLDQKIDSRNHDLLIIYISSKTGTKQF